ncbi:hypothetical protein QN360_01215 [Glaciimonas sp. CA11.2]|uniref:hypothetical protein n=1 Tax=unclassified Glaciimonas TaxID=2644401 RepID=UPI002AB44BA8|nr:MULTISPECIES: hypothetical protein [unclassified Glaciimonas]MDY7549203.1 hypothetical protein [Glaciimonas sp. CA11.2]MEB0013935.1 hypothetical protein [Glaciimonas sp. Cout2]MEB0083132.1 hypothetical protein [Glaciimonas sp. Gout2]MEB0161524.1 hypothetical protein [Glaciimonas sp. CA11.2]
MKFFLLLLKIVFAPVWIPFWIFMKCWKVLAILFIGAVIGGCAVNSAKLDMSPCACDFQPLNSTPDVGKNHA